MNRIILIAATLLLGQVEAGELYRFVDENGKVHYSDKPVPGVKGVERLKLGAEPKPDESISYETRRAMEHFPVTLYVFPDCGLVCQQARDLLNKRGIPFTEKSIKTQQELEDFRKAAGFEGMPALNIGKTWLKGFLAEQWGKELDFAGYPKTAPYRPRAAAPSTKPAP